MNINCSKNTWLQLYLVMFMLFSILLSKPASSSVLSGMIFYGHEVHTFQPCGDNKTFWIIASTYLRQELQTKSRAIISSPYEAVYVEIEGNIIHQTAAEFAKGYSGTLIINRLYSISRLNDDSCQY